MRPPPVLCWQKFRQMRQAGVEQVQRWKRKRSWVFLMLVSVCLASGRALGVPVYYNHPRIVEIADGKQSTIRPGSIEKLNPDGTRATVVSGLDDPSGIALDAAGNLYYGNVRHDPIQFDLFKRAPDGTSTYLGQVRDTWGLISIGGWAFDVAVSPSGDIFYNHPAVFQQVGWDYVRIRAGSIEKLNPDGTRTTVVSGLDDPSGIALDAAGNLYYGNVRHDPIQFELFKRAPDGTSMYLGQVRDTWGLISIGGWGFDVAIPEPGTVFLVGLGGLVILTTKRRA